MSQERESNPGAGKAGFVWPPRAMVDLPARCSSANAAEQRQPASPSSDCRSRARQSRENPEARIPAVSTRSSALSAIEDAWLDTTRPTLWRRLSAATDQQNGLDGATVCHGCGRERSSLDSGGATCGFCRRARPAWSQFVRVGPYRGVLRDAIRELKFQRGRATGAHLGRLLGARLAARLIELDRARETRRVVLVSIPTTRWRRMTRGIDHARVITRSAARQMRADLAASGHGAEVELANLLTRRHRRSQTQVAASARHRNVAGAFKPRNLAWKLAASQGKHATRVTSAGVLGRISGWIGWIWRESRRSISPWIRVLDGNAEPRPGTVIIGIDDISTTGATMHQAIRVIERAIGPRGMRAGGVRLWAAAVAVTGLKDSDK